MKTLFLDDEQCLLLREMLDLVPMTPRHLPLIVDLLQRIPEPEASVGPGPGSAPPAVHSSPTGGGFQLISHTWEGNALLAMLNRVLPHGDEL